MPIIDNGPNVEIRTQVGVLRMIIPAQMLSDLRSAALIDGLRMAANDKWLIGEIRYGGEPRTGDSVCLNCGGTEGFYAPTGAKDGHLHHYRPDSNEPSPLRRKWVKYLCPVCQDPLARLRDDLRAAGIPDPEAVIERAGDIWWSKPGREEMGSAVDRFIGRMLADQIAGSLTLVGPYGVGKTALGEFIVYACRKANRDALYVTAERFKEAVKDQFGDESSPYLQRLRTAAIVVMDQVDWIRETTGGGRASYTAELFRDVFNHRYNLRKTHATVYVVNQQAWEGQGEDVLAAIYNRMTEGEVVFAQGKGTRAEIASAVSGPQPVQEELP